MRRNIKYFNLPQLFLCYKTFNDSKTDSFLLDFVAYIVYRYYLCTVKEKLRRSRFMQRY